MDPRGPGVGIVLVRPSEPGNVGAVARAMANMGLSRLTLVEPAAPIGPAARAMATSGLGVLEAARRVATLGEAIAGAHRVLGTTSGRERAMAPGPLDPRAMARDLATVDPRHAIEIVFGPETSGLTKEELSHCGSWVTIPAASAFPTLNLAQAVLIVAYEIHRARDEAAGTRPGLAGGDPLAPAADLDGLFAQWSDLLRRAGFARDSSFGGVERDLRALLARAAPRAREARILRGIARRLRHRLERGDGSGARRP